jgi:hypothetical protein
VVCSCYPSIDKNAQVSIHLRGPMNVSQLAVYQLPNEVHTMQKRTTVPFYNRHRAVKRQEAPASTSTATMTTRPTASWFPFFKKGSTRTYNTTTSYNLTTVTSTVTVTTNCSSISTAQPVSNITYVGPPLPCLPTRTATPGMNLSSSDTNRTCNKVKSIYESPNGQLYVPATPSPTQGAPRNAKRQSDDWSRIAYYTSTAPAQATGLSFMANLGDPEMSGTFD